MGKLIKLSDDKDFKILMFLWRWKIATSAMLGCRFYGSDRSSGVYQRLLRLEQAGFVQARSDVSGSRYVWSLNTRGYAAIKSRLPALKEDGYKCEKLGHDLLVNVVHLGDWINGIPNNAEVFTEQQLRRYDGASYPDWVPDSQKHRPDGYWKIDLGNKPQIFALEVELSRKTNADYHAVADYYQGWKRILKVVWVVDKLQDANRLKKKLDDGAGSDAGFHNFLTVGQIAMHGWQAEFILGSDQGKTLAEMLHNSPITGQEPVIGQLLMNTAKSPHKTDGYKDFAAGDFCY